MTDYLEEHLGNAETLLERVRQLEQSASGLTAATDPAKNTDKMDNYVDKSQDFKAKSEIVSEEKMEVYNTQTEVNQIKKLVNNLDVDLEIRQKRHDAVVNHQIKTDDNNPDLGQNEMSSLETGTQGNLERAESRSPLSAQREELDRAASALTALIPERRETAQGGYPISLSPSQSAAAGPNITGVPGEGWSMPGAPAGAGFADGGAQIWAEQADRMFRRDSRRYDGGFYLY